MNWFLTFLFWGFIFTFYAFLGDLVLDVFDYKNEKNYITKTISGFLFTFFVGFLVGFPCQLLSLSWNVYFISLLIAYTLLIAVLVYINKTGILGKVKSLKENWKGFVITFLKEYWFIFLLIIIFTAFSLANQEAFLYMNYDDHYYIGKILNSIGTPMLGNEDYFTGALLDITGFSIERIVNTYEINYAFFSTLFHIDVPFFCRVTMVVHNYYLIFLAYKSIAQLYLKNTFSQYALLGFVVFFISHGFLMESHSLPLGINIKSYDAWQFQSAIFYGSSIVRCMSIPTVLLFGKILINKLNIKNLLFMIVISVSFMSFSTIYFQIVILLFILFLFVKLLYICIVKGKEKNYSISVLCMLVALAMLGVLVVLHYFDCTILFDANTVDYYFANYPLFRDVYIRSDFLMRIAPILLLLYLLLANNNENRCIALIVAGFFVILRLHYFANLLFMTSMGYFFVSLRTVAALQYFLVFLIGLIGIKAISFFIEKTRVYVLVSLVSVVLCLTFVWIKYDEIKTYTFLGSGMVKEGYDFARIFTNDEMVPEIVTEVGEYFDTLSYGNYKLYVPSSVPYMDTVIVDASFNIASFNVEVCLRDACNNIQNEQHMLQTYMSTSDYRLFSILEEFEVDYVLITDDVLRSISNDLGYDVVMQYKDLYNSYYLIKLN